jgi:hypothetical protein
MTDLGNRSYDEILEQDVLMRWEGRMIEYLKLGNGRRGLICNVRKTIGKLSTPELKEKCRNQFLCNVIIGIQNQKIFSVSQSCLTLYLLWEELESTPIQWTWLHELSWYHRPTAERLADEAFRSGRSATKVSVRQEKRSCEKSVGDSPPKKRGPVKVTPVNRDSDVKVASIVIVPEPTKQMMSRKEEEELRNRIVSRIQEKKEVPMGVRQVLSQAEISEKSPVVSIRSEPSDYFIGALSKEYLESERLRNARNVVVSESKKRVYVLIDLEGTSPYLTEIAVMIVDEFEILAVRLYHLKVKNKQDMIQGTKYCHGIDFEVLTSIATYSQESAVSEIRHWIENFGEARGDVMVVLSADECRESDVSELVNRWNVKYLNMKLPKWKDRINSQAYLETQIAKEASVRVKDVECPYTRLHKKD